MDVSIRARAFAIESEARQAADPATAVNLLAARCAQLESAARAEKDRADRWHARSIELAEELERARDALLWPGGNSCGRACNERHTYEPACALATVDGPVG